MTKYYFSQSVKIEKKSFKVGVREVPEAIELHPHFLRYVKSGWVSEPTEGQLRTAQVAKQPRDEQSRNAKLFEKLSQRRAIQAEPVPEEKKEEESPQQRAARTRKANAEKKKIEE